MLSELDQQLYHDKHNMHIKTTYVRMYVRTFKYVRTYADCEELRCPFSETLAPLKNAAS